MASFTLRLDDNQEKQIEEIIAKLRRNHNLTTKTAVIHHLIENFSTLVDSLELYKGKYNQANMKLNELSRLLQDKERIDRKVQEYLTQA